MKITNLSGMLLAKVKNLNGTSDKKCSVCGSWLGHWEHLSGKPRTRCANISCTEEAAVGAHVKKVDGTDEAYYIIPLCRACNQISSKKTFFVQKSLLQSAKKCYPTKQDN